MPTPTKIVVHFDDGSTTEFSVDGMSSVFLKESAAVQCGHNPPYKHEKPPKGGGGGSAKKTTTSGVSTLMATAAGNGDACYWVDGVIICP